MALSKLVFNFLPDDIAEILDEKIQTFLITLKDGYKLKEFLKDIDETINSECINLVDALYINDQKTIKKRFKNYNVIQKIFDYWIGMNFNYFCSEEMINDLTAKIVEEDNIGGYSKIKTLLTRINNKVFYWLSENTKDNQKTFLFIAKRFDTSNSRHLRINVHNNLTVQDDYRTINSISKRLCQKIAEEIRSNVANFEPTLFGVISTKTGEKVASLMNLRQPLPDILFLTGGGGSGKTTHLKKFQSDIFDDLSYGETNDSLQSYHYIPIFISLTDMRERETIKQYIVENYPLYNVILNEEKLTAVFAQQNSLIYYVIMLDGLNEYCGNTEDLFREIKTIRNKGNVKFIITSRNSLSEINIASNKLPNISEVVVEHISREQAC